MPFTPFHMGPGLAVKALGGRHFSVLVFGVAQVVIDIEPLIGMLRGSDVLHGWTHTYGGAALLGLLVMFIAPPICRPILHAWNQLLGREKLAWLASPEPLTRTAAASGAFIGTFSHVLLDSMMHADLQPYAPWLAGNGLLEVVSIATLHVFCVVTAVAGVAAWWIAGRLRGRHAIPGASE